MCWNENVVPAPNTRVSKTAVTVDVSSSLVITKLVSPNRELNGSSCGEGAVRCRVTEFVGQTPCGDMYIGKHSVKALRIWQPGICFIKYLIQILPQTTGFCVGKWRHKSPACCIVTGSKTVMFWFILHAASKEVQISMQYERTLHIFRVIYRRYTLQRWIIELFPQQYDILQSYPLFTKYPKLLKNSDLLCFQTFAIEVPSIKVDIEFDTFWTMITFGENRQSSISAS